MPNSRKVTIRVATYNLYLGGRERLDAIRQVLAHLQADVLALTEADDPAVVARLAGALNLEHVWARGSGDRHIATLSRYPIESWHIHNTAPLTQAALETQLVTPAGPLTLYNCHLLPYLLLPFELRRWQAMGKLLAIIRARQPGRHLILGDLNAIGRGDRVLQQRNPARMRRIMWLQLGLIFRLAVPRLVKAGYTDCFRILHPQADGFTWYPGNPTTRYDYIMADRQMAAALQACRVVDDAPGLTEASDHMPLLAVFNMEHT
jgi:endonuclease/exonuclease/phosphatase family metal-dependent hydrolase